jgi:hypothetical protein
MPSCTLLYDMFNSVRATSSDIRSGRDAIYAICGIFGYTFDCIEYMSENIGLSIYRCEYTLFFDASRAIKEGRRNIEDGI